MINLKDPSLLKTKCLIDGQWIGDETHDVTNPANDEVIAKVPEFGAIETQKAIDAANIALQAWGKLAGKERSIILRNWFNLITVSYTHLDVYKRQIVQHHHFLRHGSYSHRQCAFFQLCLH